MKQQTAESAHEKLRPMGHQQADGQAALACLRLGRRWRRRRCLRGSSAPCHLLGIGQLANPGKAALIRVDRLFQDLRITRVAQAQISLARLAESGAGGKAHIRLVDEPEGDVLGVRRALDLEEGVEGAARQAAVPRGPSRSAVATICRPACARAIWSAMNASPCSMAATPPRWTKTGVPEVWY